MYREYGQNLAGNCRPGRERLPDPSRDESDIEGKHRRKSGRWIQKKKRVSNFLPCAQTSPGWLVPPHSTERCRLSPIMDGMATHKTHTRHTHARLLGRGVPDTFFPQHGGPVVSGFWLTRGRFLDCLSNHVDLRYHAPRPPPQQQV